jgi:triosephosphate isomerase (TIM)
MSSTFIHQSMIEIMGILHERIFRRWKLLTAAAAVAFVATAPVQVAWGFQATPTRHRRSNCCPRRCPRTVGSSSSSWALGSTAITDSRRARRCPIVAGNWKLNPATLAEASNLLKLLHADFYNHRTRSSGTADPATLVEVVVFPPFPFLSEALHRLEGSGIKVGAQNIALYSDGAYTGEVSARQVRSMGVDYVLLGHSERRAVFGESDATINRKVHLALTEPGLAVILCVGETEDEYESDLLRSVCDVQVRKGLRGVSAGDVADRIVIAYEPVWAIGTGRVATPQQAQQAHAAIRKTVEDVYGAGVAGHIRIQYGGSVKADNVQDLMAMSDVDGALVGGASLTADSFTRIVDGAVSRPLFSPPRYRELTATEVLPTRNVLGESPVWSVRDQALYWISAPEEEVWTWNLRDPAYRRLVGTTLGCVGLLSDGSMNCNGSIVLAGERAFLKIAMAPGSGDYATGPTILCERPEQGDTTRPNDGRVDRQGRLVFGSYNNYHRTSVGDCNVCGLYRLDANCDLESLLPDDSFKYRVSNCICFPASGNTMFFCDTPTRKLYAFDYPYQKGGKLSKRREIWTMPSDWPGGPDGAQVGTLLIR